MIFPRWELRHTADPLDTRAYKGGGGSSNSQSPTTTTTNTDRRAAIQNGNQATEGATIIDYSTRADAEVLNTLAQTMPDAVKFMSDAGSRVIENMGASVVDLNRDSLEANRKSFDSVLSFGAAAVDKLIDASTKTNAAGVALAQTAMSNYQPTESKNADAMKWGLIGLAGVVAVSMMGKAK